MKVRAAWLWRLFAIQACAASMRSTVTVSAGCPSYGGQRTVCAPSPPLSAATLPSRRVASGPPFQGGRKRYRCAMARQTASQRGPALEAPAGANVGQFLGAATRGGSEFSPRRGPRAHASVIRAPVAAQPHPHPGGAATVRPNPSVKPTYSGLRPPHAAYLNR
jgi:hypothetical protein